MRLLELLHVLPFGIPHSGERGVHAVPQSDGTADGQNSGNEMGGGDVDQLGQGGTLGCRRPTLGNGLLTSWMQNCAPNCSFSPNALDSYFCSTAASTHSVRQASIQASTSSSKNTTVA